MLIRNRSGKLGEEVTNKFQDCILYWEVETTFGKKSTNISVVLQYMPMKSPMLNGDWKRKGLIDAPYLCKIHSLVEIMKCYHDKILISNNLPNLYYIGL